MNILVNDLSPGYESTFDVVALKIELRSASEKIQRFIEDAENKFKGSYVDSSGKQKDLRPLKIGNLTFHQNTNQKLFQVTIQKGNESKAFDSVELLIFIKLFSQMFNHILKQGHGLDEIIQEQGEELANLRKRNKVLGESLKEAQHYADLWKQSEVVNKQKRIEEHNQKMHKVERSLKDRGSVDDFNLPLIVISSVILGVILYLAIM